MCLSFSFFCDNSYVDISCSVMVRKPMLHASIKGCVIHAFLLHQTYGVFLYACRFMP